MTARSIAQWRFWKIFPQCVIFVLAVTLLVIGFWSWIHPEQFRSYYVDLPGNFYLTPRWVAVGSIVSAGSCLLTRAHPIPVGLMVGTYLARGLLLMTAWSTERIDPPPPGTRWMIEVSMAIILIMCASKVSTRRGRVVT